ncbi:MAG TPA: ABC transporter permease [Thermoanaerobaculia bacterium]|jgi:predicted permease
MELASQVRHAFRRLRGSPGFALLCVLTLAVGIGAVATVFSVVNGVLLDPLPYPQPDRLVSLSHTAPGLNLPHMPQSPATYLLYQRESRALASVGLYHDVQVNFTGGPSPERLTGATVTPSLLRLMGVAPALGREFTEEDARPPDGARVALLSDRLWRRSFGADRRVLGRAVRLDGVPYEIIGVMRPGFDFPLTETDLWIPLAIDPAKAPLGEFSFTGVGRLAAGASSERAQSELNGMIAGLERRFPGDEASSILVHAGLAARVHPLREDVVGDFGRVLWVLLGAVGCVLLIACANVANLLIVRGEGRRREMAVYTALGAPRGSLVGGVLAESLLLGVAGGALGLLLAFGALRLLSLLGPTELPRLANVRLDGRVLAFTLALSLLTSVLFGLLPALRSSRVEDLASELKSGGGRGATAGRSRQRARQLLSGLQIALALILLTGSGLMLRTFLRVVSVNPGFDPHGVLTLQLALPAAQYPDDASTARFYQSLSDRLQGLPGVVAAGVISELPLGGSASGTGFEIEGQPRPKGAPPPVLTYEFVSDGYFRALGIPLREGRLLEARDQEQRSGAVVVSEALAKRTWPGQSAVGKRLRPEGSNLPSGSWFTVVGVVGDVRNRDLTDDPDGIVYQPMLGKVSGMWTVRRMAVVLRTRSRPEAMAGAVRREIAALATDLPVSNVLTLDRLVERSEARVSFSVVMLALAAAVALALGAVGIYGFISYLTSQRTPEIGVRMAIGAGAWDIRWMILKESLTIVLAALAAGLAGAFWMTRWLKTLLFEVSPLDPLTFGLTSLLLIVVVLLASDLPASRAAQIDPLRALRRTE